MAEVAETFQGRPCRNGHDGLRYAKTRACVQCQRATTKKFRAKSGDVHTAYMREYAAKWYSRNPSAKLWHGAKQRAAEKNVAFSISIGDVVIPDTCPLLGIPLYVGKGRVGPNSPTLDRIVNDRGYVSGNVWVISNVANTCKGQLKAEQILYLGVRLRLRENAIVL